MKRLIICNTYYQLILAIQMRCTLFQGDDVDLWVSDHSANAASVAQRLAAQKLFHYVEFIKTKSATYGQSRLQNIKDVLRMNFGPIKNQSIALYDEIIFYNYHMQVFEISDLYQKLGHRVIWSRMEEGILSYETDGVHSGRVKLSQIIRKMSVRKDIANEVRRYYCCFPELKNPKNGLDLIRIPLIKNDDDYIRTIIKTIFDYTPLRLSQKYIYFASSSDVDGNPIGETELVLSLAKRVGVDNLLVKMHPRDTRTVYADNGIHVMQNSWIPWEVYQLCGENDNYIMLTATSGAFLSASAMNDHSPKGIFLFNKVNSDDTHIKEYINTINSKINTLHRIGKCKNIEVFYDL